MITDTVLMVKPKHFSFNTQTAASNHFQNELSLDPTTVLEQAKAEFTGVVNTLKKHGITVIQLDSVDTHTPDAIFPNNWFSTHVLDGEHVIFIYPMLNENRRAEVQIEHLQQALKTQFPERQYQIYDFRQDYQQFLEGTGVLIFDRAEKIAFMAKSERADLTLGQQVADKLGYELISFSSYDQQGLPIYHTNVMMSCGDKLAFIALEAIHCEQERTLLINTLSRLEKIVVELSLRQIHQMAGNVLELKNQSGEHFLLLSTTADKSLSQTQKAMIDQYCTRLPCTINTIETIGGGSVRCMLAEVF